MKIGIYNKYFITMGGGEKYTGAIASHLSKKHKVDIITQLEFDKKKLEYNLALDLSKVKINLLKNGPEEIAEEESKKYDLFINCTYFSTAVGKAKKNILIIYFPFYFNNFFPRWAKWIFMTVMKPLYDDNSELNILVKVLRKFKLIDNLIIKTYPKWYEQVRFFTKEGFIKEYDQAITISKYSQHWTKKFHGVDTPILYPPIDGHIFKPKKKKKIIMSVGRFFISNHNKKQLEMIRIFKEMYDKYPEMKEYEYHLGGGTHVEKEHQDYLKACKAETKNYPVFIHENIPFKDLKELYSHAGIFWHGSGFNENPNKFPDRFEHFGITTVEAMAAGAVPIVINMAGQKETVEEGQTGYLWDTKEELIEKTLKVVNDEKLRQRLSKNAIKASGRFSRKNFNAEIDKLFKKYLKK
jgi:glycosyltransferase involved in cell wall biosynthesis